MKKKKGIPELPKGTERILCIDPSGEHLAYSILDLSKDSAIIDTSGMLWVRSVWSRGKRLGYMHDCIKFLINEFSPQAVYTESFFFNPKQKTGSFVIPIINGLLEIESAKNDIPYNDLSPSTWRSKLQIKPDYLNGKRDYKSPTKRYIEANVGTIPEFILSNITLNVRATPHDIYDSIAIGIAVCLEHGISKFKILETACNKDVLINQINNLKD